MKTIKMVIMGNNGTYVFNGAKIEIEKCKGSDFSCNEDYKPEERSEIMRGLAKQIVDYENTFRPTEVRFVYNRGIQEIRMKSGDEPIQGSDKPTFSGIIKYFSPYAGFDVTGDYSARVKTFFDFKPRM